MIKIIIGIILGFLIATVFYFPKAIESGSGVPTGPNFKSYSSERSCFGLKVKDYNPIPEGSNVSCLGIPYGEYVIVK